MEPTWGPPGSCRPQMGSILALRNLQSGNWHPVILALHTILLMCFVVFLLGLQWSWGVHSYAMANATHHRWHMAVDVRSQVQLHHFTWWSGPQRWGWVHRSLSVFKLHINSRSGERLMLSSVLVWCSFPKFAKAPLIVTRRSQPLIIYFGGKKCRQKNCILLLTIRECLHLIHYTKQNHNTKENSTFCYLRLNSWWAMVS